MSPEHVSNASGAKTGAKAPERTIEFQGQPFAQNESTSVRWLSARPDRPNPVGRGWTFKPVRQKFVVSPEAASANFDDYVRRYRESVRALGKPS